MCCRFASFGAGRSAGVFLVLYMLALADVVSAQDAGIIGQVKDESGAVLPGVTVTASSPALLVKETSDVTNAQGEYRITPLPIGIYTVTYTLDGFQTLRQESLRLEIGVQARLDITLKVGSLEETVTVSGVAPVVDVTATSASTQFTRETFELTPTSRNGVISLVAQAPGVRGNVDIGGGTVGDVPAFRTFGQPTESYIVMEGIVTSDSRIGSQGGNYFDYGAMEEARVQSIGNGPEVPSRGVALLMIVKGGGNEFHGGANYAYTSHRFESDNISSGLRAQGITSGNPLKSRGDQGGDIGGRIIRDKLWFYGSARYRPQRILQLGGFKPDGTQADAYRGEIIENEKVSYQLSGGNKLMFWGQWAQKYHYGENVNEFVAWESRNDRRPPVRTNTWKTEWQAVRGNSLVMSFLFGRWTWTGGTNIDEISGNIKQTNIKFTNAADQGGGRPSMFDQTTQRVTGTPPGGGNYADIERYTSKATVSWYKPNVAGGNHEFKAGTEYSSPLYTRANGDRGAAGQYRLVFNNGAPLQMDLYNFPVSPLTGVKYFNLYGNDTWTIARRLTLDLGLRYSLDVPNIPPQCRPAGAWPFTPAACIERIPYKSYNSVAPRMYFSYDVTGDARTVVKGGWGRFYLQRFMEQVELANPFVAITYNYRWRDLNGNRNYDAGEINLDPNGPDFISSNESGGGISNPDEKVPGTDQFALTFERQLGRDFAVRASGVYIRTFNEPRVLNILRPYSAYNIPITNRDPGPDGVLNNADDPGTSVTYYDFPASLAGRQNERFMLVNDPRSNEKHSSIELQMTKRISSRWQFLASYSATKNQTLVPHPGNESSPLNPNVEINTGNNTWEWIGRVSGIYLLPWSLSLSANFDHRSGDPQARQVLFRGGVQVPNLVVNVEPLGSINMPHANVVDLRVDRAFRLPRGQRVSVRANLFNALNDSTVTARNLRAGTAYLRPTSIQRPRIMEFGISYSF